jgi:two-component system, NarL family, nitrate/nitrite response regulator NarL
VRRRGGCCDFNRIPVSAIEATRIREGLLDGQAAWLLRAQAVDRTIGACLTQLPSRQSTNTRSCGKGVQSLQRAKGLICIGEGETAADALRIAALQKPDILILGVFIAGGGIEAARAILSAHHNIKVLILTASDDEVYLKKALKAGVRAYVLKGISGSELAHIVRAAHAGEFYIAPALSAQLLISMSLERPPSVRQYAGLSHREQQVLAGVCKGLTDKEIADTLHVKPSTIRYYLTHIFKKLNVHNRLQAMLMSRDLSKTKV